jgi:hypothetical protein
MIGAASGFSPATAAMRVGALPIGVGDQVAPRRE